MQKRKSYTREFKLEAVRLLERGDRPAADIARELGIKRNQLYKWQEQLAQRGEAAFPGQGRPANDKEAEIASLKRELERVTEERDILKKAAQYFARMNKWGQTRIIEITERSMTMPTGKGVCHGTIATIFRRGAGAARYPTR